jgi:hypothetical protein
MAKKNKKPDRNDALNELKTLEAKWLKDHRVEGIDPIPAKVMAAKVAALIEFIESNEIPVSYTDWPLQGAEELVKLDETNFKKSLDQLQKAGVINSSFKIRKVAANQKKLDLESEEGILTYRCVKAGGLNLSDRDEYLPEEEEVTYTEEDISGSQSLQNAIANEWLIRVETKAQTE